MHDTCEKFSLDGCGPIIGRFGGGNYCPPGSKCNADIINALLLIVRHCEQSRYIYRMGPVNSAMEMNPGDLGVVEISKAGEILIRNAQQNQLKYRDIE